MRLEREREILKTLLCSRMRTEGRQTDGRERSSSSHCCIVIIIASVDFLFSALNVKGGRREKKVSKLKNESIGVGIFRLHTARRPRRIQDSRSRAKSRRHHLRRRWRRPRSRFIAPLHKCRGGERTRTARKAEKSHL